MSVRHYRDLMVWQKAVKLAVRSYEVTRQFPKAELFGLTSQIRRAAASVAANIAEGHSRTHTKEYLNHLSMARGSLVELETHLTLSHAVGYFREPLLSESLTMCDEISRMLSALRKSLERRI